ncbi:MAG: hypothetical protein MI921_23650 [Cytophagales bacterium]|nr:hypothetical protein [Cytophagales bacterium]
MTYKAWEKFISLIMISGLLIGALGVITSCEDEVVDRFVDIPGDTISISGLNQIISFELEEFSADTILEAAIVNDSLIIYWPSYRDSPTSISPKIIVPQGASIAPASGESVPFETGTSYTVTAEDKSERTYILKVVFYQPMPWYGRNILNSNDLKLIEVFDRPETILRLDGDFFIPDTTQTKMYITKLDTEKETQLEITQININQIFLKIPVDIEKGYYRTNLVSGIHSVKDDSVWVKFGEPFFFWFDQITAEQGANFQIEGVEIRDIEKMQMFIVNPETSMEEALPPFEIVDYTTKSITLRVPDDFPAGDYWGDVHVTTPWASSGEGKVIAYFAPISVTAPQ